MAPEEALQVLLKSYQRYYNVLDKDVEAPFAAEAVFHTHEEQYFLVRSARLGEAQSHEYVFFALAKDLSLADVQALDACAWERGCSRVVPGPCHRNSDVAVVILAEHIDADAKAFIAKCSHYRSYRYTLYGWSHYKLIALETSSGELSSNRRGRDLEKLFGNIRHEGRKEKIK